MFPNFRDVGGLPVSGGGRTRFGVLFRSAAPIPGDVVPECLRTPTATVIDLRAGDERPQYSWPQSFTVLRHNLFDAADLTRLRGHDLTSLYAEMSATAAKRIVGAAELVAADGPTLVHCTAGKDRTGVTIATLLQLAGVESEAIIADYQRTEGEMARVVRALIGIGAIERSEVTPMWFVAPTRAIRTALSAVIEHPGGPDAWYVDNGGRLETLTRLRSRLCEGPVGGFTHLPSLHRRCVVHSQRM